jgi:hypothetical protein
MKKYYTHDGIRQQGPYSIDELKTTGIHADVYVWFDELSDWQLAGSIEELKQLFFNNPPPFHSSNDLHKPMSVSRKESSFRLGKVVGRFIVVTVILVLLGWGGSYLYGWVEENKIKDQIRNNIAEHVIPGNSEYRYSKLGGISGLKISVSNNTQYRLDQVKVRVDYHKPNGTIWDYKIVVFTNIAAFETATLPVDDTQRGVKITYQIISVKSAALDI